MRYILLFTLCLSPALVTAQSKTKTSALYYLMKYGYVQSNNATSALLTEDKLDQYLDTAIKDFQAFAGINQTGILDEQTAKLMDTPRCGVRDIIGHGATSRRKKRYALQGGKWRVTDLTWRVSKYPSSSSTRLSKAEILKDMRAAFKVWSDVSKLTFTEKKSGSVHIDIRFESFEHGDGDPFDGPGGTLAHAYFPQYGGDVHMDDSETWTINSFRGTNLLQTFAHEIGHSLGLSHSDDQNALMAPFYQGWKPNFKLDQDDIRGIQALYGKHQPKPTPPPTTAAPSTTEQPSNQGPGGGGGNPNSLCGSSKFDAIVKTEDGTSYVFKGSKFWELTDDSVADGYPKDIFPFWPGLPNDIDAAFTWPESGSTYFFKGNEYWKFENQIPEIGYPKQLDLGFPGIPGNLDTAYVWSGNGKIYFTKGNNYWKFDPSRTPFVQKDKYPRDISLWGLPGNLDGALQWDNGKTYFFKDGEYWRFNDLKFDVDRGTPSFPRNTGQWWFGCPRSSAIETSEVVLELGTDSEDVKIYDYTDNTDSEEDYYAEYYATTGGDEDLAGVFGDDFLSYTSFDY